MDPRKISVKLRRDPRETAERHSQANPLTLECTLASGEAVTETMDLRAELHAAQTPATTPLATTATVVMAAGSAGPWELEFSGAQMNQTVLPDSAEDFWLVIYATNAGDDLFTLGKIALTLTFDNVSQATPPPPEPPLYATYAFRTFAVAGQSSVVAETTQDTLTLVAGSNITITTNAATDTITISASGGGGGGATDLSTTLAPTTVTINSSTGADAVIPSADATNAGILTTSFWSKLNDLPTADSFGDLAFQNTIGAPDIDSDAVTEAKIANGAVTASKIGTGAVGSTQLASTAVTAGSYTLTNLTVDADGRITAASNGTAGSGTVTTVSVTTANGVSGSVATATTTPAITLTLGAITPTSVNGITLSGTSTPTLAVSGTTSVSGTNTGDQTITLTGDVTGSGTGSFATTLANSGVTAGSYIRATITVDAKGRVTAASSNTAGEINGTVGTVDNAIPRADGTGGSALQGSSIVIDDIDATTQQNVALRNVDPATNSAVVITPKGTGAFIVGPKPDGLSTGGDARGVRAIDLQRSRSLSTHIASNTDSALIGGANNTASGQRSGVFCGESNTSSASRSACLAGQGNTASAAEAVTTGGIGALANRIGMQAQSNGIFSSTGDAQRGTLILRRQTTDATQTELTLDGGTPTGTAITTSDRIILLNNQTIMADVYVVARSASGTNDAGYHRRCLITRDANAASTAITGLQTIGSDMETAGASAWDVTLAADTTNGSLQVLVTGAAATNINWVAEVNLREVIRA